MKLKRDRLDLAAAETPPTPALHAASVRHAWTAEVCLGLSAPPWIWLHFCDLNLSAGLHERPTSEAHLSDEWAWLCHFRVPSASARCSRLPACELLPAALESVGSAMPSARTGSVCDRQSCPSNHSTSSRDSRSPSKQCQQSTTKTSGRRDGGRSTRTHIPCATFVVSVRVLFYTNRLRAPLP